MANPKFSRAEAVTHLEEHIQYPATKKELMDACMEMSDVPKADKEWLAKTLPDGTYMDAGEVKMALGME